MKECGVCRGTGWARADRRRSPRFDPVALSAVIAQVERQLVELDARTADLKQRLQGLRGMLT
jgi:hypothetical protein